MDREILFRGKRIFDNEWVYGDFLQVIGQKPKVTCIMEQTPVAKNFTVVPETVGQYTGLTDKNGKRIFEGDIIRRENDDIFEIAYIEKYMRFVARRPNTVFSVFSMDTVEIIGNIHDNKQMLGRADMPVPDDVFQPVLMPATPENFELMHG